MLMCRVLVADRTPERRCVVHTLLLHVCFPLLSGGLVRMFFGWVDHCFSISRRVVGCARSQVYSVWTTFCGERLEGLREREWEKHERNDRGYERMNWRQSIDRCAPLFAGVLKNVRTHHCGAKQSMSAYGLKELTGRCFNFITTVLPPSKYPTFFLENLSLSMRARIYLRGA